MPHFLETEVRVIPLRRSRTIAARSMFIGARPIRTPSSFALRMPAKTRSRIKSDSSSAIEPMRVKKSRPIGPLGLQPSEWGIAFLRPKDVLRFSTKSHQCRLECSLWVLSPLPTDTYT